MGSKKMQMIVVLISMLLVACGANSMTPYPTYTLYPTYTPIISSHTSQPTITPEIRATNTPLVFTPIPFTPTPAELSSIPNLIENGFFTERYDGWTREVIDEGGSSKTEIIPFSSSDSGAALHLQHEGNGGVYFYQEIDIPSVDLIFSVTFKAHSEEGPMIGFSGTGVAQIILMYFDATGNELGRTSIYNYVENIFAGSALVGVPERVRETNALHYIDAESEKLYKDFEIDVRQEIEDNLVMIRPEHVKTIAVILLCSATDTQAKSELIVADVILRAK